MFIKSIVKNVYFLGDTNFRNRNICLFAFAFFFGFRSETDLTETLLIGDVTIGVKIFSHWNCDIIM